MGLSKAGLHAKIIVLKITVAPVQEFDRSFYGAPCTWLQVIHPLPVSECILAVGVCLHQAL